MKQHHKRNGHGGQRRKKKETIGQVIKAARKRLKMKAEDVAQECNVSRSRLYKWEAEKYIMPKNLGALSRVLRVPRRKLEAVNCLS